MSDTLRPWENFYEKAWQARLDKMRAYRDAGENHPLRLIHRFQSFQRLNHAVNTGEKVEFVPAQFNLPPDFISPSGYPFLETITFLDNEIQIPAYYFKQIHLFLADYLANNPVDAVVELGSGYSENLINLYYQGGPKVPYYAGEFTQSGTECAQMLADMSDEMNLIPFRFNHREPDLSAVKEKQNILVFTCHTLEQIDEIPEIFFKTIADHAVKVTCVHFEPFGYQIRTSKAPLSPIDQKHKDFFEKNGWNRNLYPMLVACNQKKIISLKCVAKNIFGGDIANPTSFALWKNH